MNRFKPFCKVCFDTGKSEKEYTSHYVKNIPGPNGTVICPTLLSLECRYCKTKGHTISRCPHLKDKKRDSVKNNKFMKKTNLSNNKFHVLNEEHDSDKEPEKPELIRNPNSYANIVLKNIPQSPPGTPPPSGYFEPHTPPGTPPPSCYFEPCTPPGTPPPLPKITINWSDLESDKEDN